MAVELAANKFASCTQTGGQLDVERKGARWELAAGKQQSGWGHGSIMNRGRGLGELLRPPTGLE